MLLSMTGFGESHHRHNGRAVSVEVRTVNSRYFKLRAPARVMEPCRPDVESAVRERIRRGTIQVNIRVDHAKSVDDYHINVPVLTGYRQQIESLHQEWNLDGPVSLESLLLLPGVVDETAAMTVHVEDDWPLVRETLRSAIDHMDQMRQDEGRAMAADLEANCRTVAACLDVVQERAPLVAHGYRARLEERLRKTLAEFNVTLDPADLIRR